jgi:hypothetical protein
MTAGRSESRSSGATAAVAAHACHAAAAVKEDAAEEARKIIWAKEMAIYEGRSKGMIDFYLANASPNFLAWTAGTPIPFRADKLRAGQAKLRGNDKEGRQARENAKRHVLRDGSASAERSA